MTSSPSFSPTLRALVAEATSGPWRTDLIANVGRNWLIADLGEWPSEDQERYEHWIVTTDRVHSSELSGEGSRGDSKLIVFLVNRAAAIAELVEAAAYAEEQLSPLHGLTHIAGRLRAALAKLEEGA